MERCFVALQEGDISQIKRNIKKTPISVGFKSKEKFSSETRNRPEDVKVPSVLLKCRHPQEIKEFYTSKDS